MPNAPLLLPPYRILPAELRLAARLVRRVLAPILIHYCYWLHDEAKRDGVDQLLFLARDGYLLQQLYIAVIPESERLTSHYAFASRRLFNVPAIRELDDTALNFLVGDQRRMPVAKYLARIGISPTVCARELTASGFADAESIIDPAHDIPRLKELYRRLEPRILRQTAAERELVTSYIRGMVDVDSGRCGVVDVGWNGTLQASLEAVMELEPGKIKGYYVGLYPSARRRHAGAMRAYVDAARWQDTVWFRYCLERCIDWYELILSEPLGSITGLRRTSTGCFEAIRSDQRLPEDQQSWVSAIQQNLIHAASNHHSRLGAGRKLAWLSLLRLVNLPTPAEAAVIGDLYCQSGFGGSDDYAPLARPAHSSPYYLTHVSRWREEWRASVWKPGFVIRSLSGR